LEIFFFQAEDGIRDYKVTGVQTCALPICAAPGLSRRGGGSRLRRLAPPLSRRRLSVHPLPCRTHRAVAPPGRSRQRRPQRGKEQIGRASCRERGRIWGGEVRWKRKNR